MPSRRASPRPDNGLQSIEIGPLVTLERWTWTDGAVPQDRHAHSQWQICEYLDAPGHYVHRGTRHAVAPGSFVLVPPGDVHCPVDDEIRLGAHYRVWYFDERRLAAITAEAGVRPPRRRRLPLVWRDVRVNRLLAAIAHGPTTDASLAATEALIARLAGFDEVALADATARTVGESSLLSARDYLFDHPGRAVSVAELAGVSGLSPSRLAHAFERRFAISPYALSLRVRTDHARRALLADAAIADAAAHAGFADQAHLTRNFRRFVGPTPHAYLRLAGSFKTPPA